MNEKKNHRERYINKWKLKIIDSTVLTVMDLIMQSDLNIVFDKKSQLGLKL